MARRRTIRMPQEELQDKALRTSSEFQRIALESLIEHKWEVTGIYPHPRGHGQVVIARIINQHSIGTAVYPDGSFARSKTPTVKWDWDRCERASTATIPDQYVKDVLAKRAAQKAQFVEFA